MHKQSFLKSTIMTAAVTGMILLTACGDVTSVNSVQPQSDTVESVEEIAKSEIDSVPVEPEIEIETESKTEPNIVTSEEQDNTESQPENDVIEKIIGGADESGIYSIVITLSDSIADKGKVEMVYYGAEGSAQEGAVVNTFVIDYSKNSDGTYEINTFYDGEVYMNLHKKESVKVNNTFGANVRAGSVIITYTPDGGETTEIYRADASEFFVPTT